MNTTVEINRWIVRHGSQRDALNVAITRLAQLRAYVIDEFEICPICHAAIKQREKRVNDIVSFLYECTGDGHQWTLTGELMNEDD